MAGYAFARMRFAGSAAIFAAMLSILMIPNQAYLIPQYQIVQKLGLLDTVPGIVVPMLFSAFGTFLMRQFFVSLPQELEEAARLDGANSFQIFWRVMLPLAKPSISALAIITMLAAWNNLLWPLVVTSREESRTLSVGIASLNGQYVIDYPVMMAASLMAMAPILILFVILQRRMIEGLAFSGLKG
jgi:multiple sugar transport system permease protein